MEIPFSPAADRNKAPILAVLKKQIKTSDKFILEIGAGTGQHAGFFAPFFDEATWLATEQSENLAMLTQGLASHSSKNIAKPQVFKVGEDEFPRHDFDVVYTANTFHIMSWVECQSLIELLGKSLKVGARFVVYGPFNYNGKYTSPSNENFDKTYLRMNFPFGGIRNFEDVRDAFEKAEFNFTEDYEMPSNNRTLVFTHR